MDPAVVVAEGVARARCDHGSVGSASDRLLGFPDDPGRHLPPGPRSLGQSEPAAFTGASPLEELAHYVYGGSAEIASLDYRTVPDRALHGMTKADEEED